jgi:hypothetical protein
VLTPVVSRPLLLKREVSACHHPCTQRPSLPQGGGGGQRGSPAAFRMVKAIAYLRLSPGRSSTSPSPGVDGGSARLARGQLTHSLPLLPHLPQQRGRSQVQVNVLPPPAEMTAAATTSVATAADFLALYQQCVNNGLRAHFCIKHSFG